MTPAGHALVVGGTGMLRDVALRLAERFATVSVIARRNATLSSLKQDAGPLAGRLQAFQVDYHLTAPLREVLEQARQQFGDYSLGIGWIHSTAAGARETVVDVMNQGSSQSRYFDVVGSLGPNPLTVAEERATQFDGLEHVMYRAVVLGFMPDTGGSRWLTNQEISRGVLQAVDQDAVCAVVGTVEPWTARP